MERMGFHGFGLIGQQCGDRDSNQLAQHRAGSCGHHRAAFPCPEANRLRVPRVDRPRAWSGRGHCAECGASRLRCDSVDRVDLRQPDPHGGHSAGVRARDQQHHFDHGHGLSEENRRKDDRLVPAHDRHRRHHRAALGAGAEPRRGHRRPDAGRLPGAGSSHPVPGHSRPGAEQPDQRRGKRQSGARSHLRPVHRLRHGEARREETGYGAAVQGLHSIRYGNHASGGPVRTPLHAIRRVRPDCRHGGPLRTGYAEAAGAPDRRQLLFTSSSCSAVWCCWWPR